MDTLNSNAMVPQYRALQSNEELVPMDASNSNALVLRHGPQDVSIPPSSLSDSDLITEAGGDPMQSALARGDPEQSLAVVNQELRDELAEMQQSYHLEVHASRVRSQELSTRYSSQAWRAIQYQNERFQNAAHQYELASADVTEAAVAQERAQQRAAQQQQLNGYQSALIQIEARVQQHEHLLQQAQQAHAEALQEQYSDAIAENRAQLVTEAENVLIQEQMKQQQIKADYLRSLAQTHAAADTNLQQAHQTIQGLQGTIQQQELSQAKLQGIVHKMQIAIDNQNRHITTELNSVKKRHEAEVQQIQEQQALQAQQAHQQQLEREIAWNREITKLTADLQQSQAQGQAQAQRAHTLRDQLLAEQRAPLTPSFSPAMTHTPPSVPLMQSAPPAVHPPRPEPPPDFFEFMRGSAGGDPMQAGGDSTQEQNKASTGDDPSRMAGGDPSENNPKTSNQATPQMNQLVLKEAQVLVFEPWPAYHRFDL